MKNQKLRWMRLDNAAKIFPASLRKNWSNAFRVSATLTESADYVSERSFANSIRSVSSEIKIRSGLLLYIHVKNFG